MQAKAEHDGAGALSLLGTGPAADVSCDLVVMLEEQRLSDCTSNFTEFSVITSCGSAPALGVVSLIILVHEIQLM